MTAIAIIFRIAVIFFVSEGLIMLIMPQAMAMLSLSPAMWPVIGAVSLVLLASPVTYLWVIRPYVQICVDAGKYLQIQVEKRTHELTREISQRKEVLALLEDEVNAARLMQEGLLPSPDFIKKVEGKYGLNVSSYFKTSSSLGGDLWGFHKRGMMGGQVGFYMVDFTGHGVSAAVNTFRLDGMMNEMRPMDGNPAAYLTLLNDQLERLLPKAHFATFFYGVLDAKSNVFTYAAAAAPPPLFRRQGATELEFLDTRGLPLGVKKGASYENRRIDFPSGSLLFFYCDAFVETQDREGKALLEEGVKELLKESLDRVGFCSPLDYIVNAFHEKFGPAIADDLTAVMLRRV